MKRNVILVLSNNDTLVRKLMKIYTSVTFEFTNDTEEAIEKLNLVAVGAVLADASLETQEIGKLQKIAQILNQEMLFETANFADETDLETKIQAMRTELFRRRMGAYNFEDNPNLNNPFLNLDKTNVFNQKKEN